MECVWGHVGLMECVYVKGYWSNGECMCEGSVGLMECVCGVGLMECVWGHVGLMESVSGVLD